jgi:uroporphyrinogen-III decarboxylase
VNGPEIAIGGLAGGWAIVPDRAVQGNLDPSLLLGPFDAVADQARWILDQAAGRPGHVFNLGHGVLPGTDPDDLRRLVDLVHGASARPTAWADPSLLTSATTRSAR